MNEGYQPRRYHKPLPIFWWLQRRSYIVFALRELSCVFVAWFVAFLLLLVSAVGEGTDDYQHFLTMATSPWLCVMNVVALVFILLHAITWLHLIPQVIVLRVRGRRVARFWYIAFLYACWIVLSCVEGWILLDG